MRMNVRRPFFSEANGGCLAGWLAGAIAGRLLCCCFCRFAPGRDTFLLLLFPSFGMARKMETGKKLCLSRAFSIFWRKFFSSSPIAAYPLWNVHTYRVDREEKKKERKTVTANKGRRSVEAGGFSGLSKNSSLSCRSFPMSVCLSVRGCCV